MLETEALLLELLSHRAMLPEYARDPSHIERNTLLLQKPLAVLDSALNGRAHLAGENFTVADLNVASILVWGKIAGLNFSRHPNVARWLEKSLARPAYSECGIYEIVCKTYFRYDEVGKSARYFQSVDTCIR